MLPTSIDDPPTQKYLLESLSDRDRLYLMFDLLHDSFLDDVGRALGYAGKSLHPDADFRLLDGACGEGLHAAEIGKHHPRAEVVAFDRDPEAMQTAPLAFAQPNVRYLLHDAQEPLPADVARGFDVAQLRFCLTHLTDPLRALGHLRDALRPGGVLYLIDPRADAFDYDHPSMRVLSDAIMRSWEHFGTSAAGERQAPLLAQAGFEILDSAPQDHVAGGTTEHGKGIMKLIIETARSTRKALVETTKLISGDEFDEHLRRLALPEDPPRVGRCRFQVTFARNP